MLPVRKRRKVIFRRQRPLLHTHCVQNGEIAGKATLNGDWTNLPSLVLVQILLNISSPEDRRSVRLACRSWNQCMKEPRLWRTVQVHLPTVCTLRSVHWSLLQYRHISRLSLGALSPSTLPQILRKVTHNLPGLRFLGLELRNTKRKSTCYDLQVLSDFNSLVELTIHGSLISVHFPSVPLLKRLVIQNRVEVIFSVELPNLETLSMVLEQNDTLCLGNFSRLRSLCLTRSVLSFRTFTSATPSTATFPAIEHLDISYSQLSWGVKQLFTKFPNLFSLNVAHCNFSERDLMIMMGLLRQLKELILTGNDTTDAVVSALSAPLESLTVQRSTKLTDEGLKQLARHSSHSLTSLDLSHSTRISQHTLSELKTWFPLIITLKS